MRVLPGCHLEVTQVQRAQLSAWLKTRGLADQPLILMQIGNKRTMRRGPRRLAVNNKYWPNERWAEVLRFLRQRHPQHALVLLGTGPEFQLNQELASLAGIGGLHNVADDLPIPRLVSLLDRAAGLVTVDSGPAHAAAAVGCPQVVLFGKALPSLYRPWGTAGADVQLLTGLVRRRTQYAGHRRGQRDRGVVHAQIARALRRWSRCLGRISDAGARRRAQHILRHEHHTALGDEETLRVHGRILSNLQAVRNHATLIENAARDLAMPADRYPRQQHGTLDHAGFLDAHVVRQQRLPARRHPR